MAVGWRPACSHTLEWAVYTAQKRTRGAHRVPLAVLGCVAQGMLSIQRGVEETADRAHVARGHLHGLHAICVESGGVGAA